MPRSQFLISLAMHLLLLCLTAMTVLAVPTDRPGAMLSESGLPELGLSGRVGLSYSRSKGLKLQRTVPVLSACLDESRMELSTGFLRPSGIMSRLIRPAVRTDPFRLSDGIQASSLQSSLISGKIVAATLPQSRFFLLRDKNVGAGAGGIIFLPVGEEHHAAVAGLILHRRPLPAGSPDTGNGTAAELRNVTVPWTYRPADSLVALGGQAISPAEDVMSVLVTCSGLLRIGWAEDIGFRLSPVLGIRCETMGREGPRMRLELTEENGLRHLGWNNGTVRTSIPVLRRRQLAATLSASGWQLAATISILSGERPTVRLHYPYCAEKRAWSFSHEAGKGDIVTKGWLNSIVRESGYISKTMGVSLLYRRGTGKSAVSLGIKGELECPLKNEVRKVTKKATVIARWRDFAMTWQLGATPVLSWSWKVKLGAAAVAVRLSTQGTLALGFSWEQKTEGSSVKLFTSPVSDQADFPPEVDAGFLEDSFMEDSGELEDI